MSGEPEKRRKSTRRTSDMAALALPIVEESDSSLSKKSSRRHKKDDEPPQSPEPSKPSEGEAETPKKKSRKKDGDVTTPRAEEPATPEPLPGGRRRSSRRAPDPATEPDSSSLSELPSSEKAREKKHRSSKKGDEDSEAVVSSVASTMSFDGEVKKKKKKKEVVDPASCPFNWGEINSDLSTSFSDAEKPSHSLSIDQEKLDAEAAVHRHEVLLEERFPKPVMKGVFKATFTVKGRIEVHRLKRHIPHKKEPVVKGDGTAKIKWLKAKKSTAVQIIVKRHGKKTKVVKKLRELQLDGPQTETWEYEGGKVSAKYQFTPVA